LLAITLKCRERRAIDALLNLPDFAELPIKGTNSKRLFDRHACFQRINLLLLHKQQSFLKIRRCRPLVSIPADIPSQL